MAADGLLRMTGSQRRSTDARNHSLLLLLLLELVGHGAASPRPLHVLLTVIDDLGFDDMGFANAGQISTPTFDFLHANGVHLASYYVQASCSPTRATILTGRMPVHTGINFWIPNAAYGLPLNETILPSLMKTRGFRVHAVGKWHLGLHKTEYLPTFRGFQSFYGYYEGSEDYFSHNFYGKGLDFHQEDAEYCGQRNCSKLLWEAVGSPSRPDFWNCYSTHLFAKRASDVITLHEMEYGKETPLFLYLAWQGVHEPNQSPQHYIEPYRSKIANKERQIFAGMLSSLDEGQKNVTDALKAAGMFDDTLIVVTTDNGGPTTECSTTGQSNWPLRGSKCSIWEGGTKGVGFFYWSGLPDIARGLQYQGLMHAADWLPTIISAVTGGKAVQLGETLPLDGLDMWEVLSANLTSPRENIYYGINQAGHGPAVRDTNGIKIIVGGDGGGRGLWSPEQRPNASNGEGGYDIRSMSLGTTDTPQAAVYFNVQTDEGERRPLNVSAGSAAVAAKRLQAVIDLYAKTKVPQASSDPSCPPFQSLNTTEGKYIGPWCD